MARDMRPTTVMSRVVYKDGEEIVVAKKRSPELFFLVEGELEVVSEGTSVCTLNEPGAAVGEICALLNIGHTATVRAVGEAKLNVAPTVERAFEIDPGICLMVARGLARKLSATNTFLANLKREFIAEIRSTGFEPDSNPETVRFIQQWERTEQGFFRRYFKALRSPFHKNATFRPGMVTAGQDLIVEGKRAKSIYILQRGGVEILKDGVSICKISERGAVFGEIAQLLKCAHTATVRATVDSGYDVIDDIQDVFETQPIVALHITRLLAKRLLTTSEYYVALKRRFEAQRPKALKKEPEKLEQIDSFWERTGNELRKIFFRA